MVPLSTPGNSSKLQSISYSSELSRVVAVSRTDIQYHNVSLCQQRYLHVVHVPQMCTCIRCHLPSMCIWHIPVSLYIHLCMSHYMFPLCANVHATTCPTTHLYVPQPSILINMVLSMALWSATILIIPEKKVSTHQKFIQTRQKKSFTNIYFSLKLFPKSILIMHWFIHFNKFLFEPKRLSWTTFLTSYLNNES